MTDFLDFFWLMLWAFLWIIWIMLLFRVFADIFSSDQSGFAKAMWVIFVIVFPFLGILIYLIAQGGNMATREVAAAQAAPDVGREMRSMRHECAPRGGPHRRPAPRLRKDGMGGFMPGQAAGAWRRAPAWGIFAMLPQGMPRRREASVLHREGT